MMQISTLKFASRAKNIKNCPLVNGEIEYDPQVLLRKYEDELKNLQAKSANQELDRLIENPHTIQNESRTDTSDYDHKEAMESQTELDKYKGLLLRQRDIMIAMTARLNNRDETIINLQSEVEMLNQRNLELENELIKTSEDYSDYRQGSNSKISSMKSVKRSPSRNPSDDKSEAVRSYADGLKKGLDLVINVLTKENTNLDLGSIAQKLLALQGMSHQLSKAVSDK